MLVTNSFAARASTASPSYPSEPRFSSCQRGCVQRPVSARPASAGVLTAIPGSGAPGAV